MTTTGFERGAVVVVVEPPTDLGPAIGTLGYVNEVDPADEDFPLGVIFEGWLGPVWCVPRQLRHAPGIHCGEPVTVHSERSRFDGCEGRAEFPDAEGGFEVSIDGALLHFELSEIAPRRLIGAAGGGLS